MPKIKNNQAEVKEIIKFLKSKKLNRREYLRIHSILLRKKKYSRSKVLDINQISLKALEKWNARYNQGGIKALLDKKNKKPNHCILSKNEKDKVKQIITKKSPQELGFQEEFWNPNNLKQLIKKEYNKEYTVKESYRRLLKYCGFSYQKVAYQDSRQNKDDQEDMKLRLKKKLKKGVLKMSW